jgi:hypothetical protein
MRFGEALDDLLDERVTYVQAAYPLVFERAEKILFPRHVLVHMIQRVVSAFRWYVKQRFHQFGTMPWRLMAALVAPGRCTTFDKYRILKNDSSAQQHCPDNLPYDLPFFNIRDARNISPDDDNLISRLKESWQTVDACAMWLSDAHHRLFALGASIRQVAESSGFPEGLKALGLRFLALWRLYSGKMVRDRVSALKSRSAPALGPRKAIFVIQKQINTLDPCLDPAGHLRLFALQLRDDLHRRKMLPSDFAPLPVEGNNDDLTAAEGKEEMSNVQPPTVTKRPVTMDNQPVDHRPVVATEQQKRTLVELEVMDSTFKSGFVCTTLGIQAELRHAVENKTACHDEGRGLFAALGCRLTLKPDWLEEDGQELVLSFSLPPNYPSTRCVVSVHCTAFTREQLDQLEQAGNQATMEEAGQECIAAVAEVIQGAAEIVWAEVTWEANTDDLGDNLDDDTMWDINPESAEDAPELAFPQRCAIRDVPHVGEIRPTPCCKYPLCASCTSRNMYKCPWCRKRFADARDLRPSDPQTKEALIDSTEITPMEVCRHNRQTHTCLLPPPPPPPHTHTHTQTRTRTPHHYTSCPT